VNEARVHPLLGLRRAAVAAFLFAATPTAAIDVPLPLLRSVTLHGYYKNFLVGIDSPEPLLDSGVADLNRARLMLEGDITGRLDFAVHYEQIAQIHPIRGGAGFVGPTQRPGIVDLSWKILSNDDVEWRHEIDRLSVHARFDRADITVGRQAIGWGVGLLWSPLDLLAGFSPVQIDREYRTGIDAARILMSLGPFTEVEAVYAAFDRPFADQAAALRWRTTLAESNADVGLLAGNFFADAVLGAFVSGELGGAGLHGALNFTHHYGEREVGPRDFVRLDVGADYRFAHDVTAVGEYYFNGWGATDPADYAGRFLSDRVARGEIFNAGRHYLGFLVDWEAHPLLHLLARGQWNLTDPSAQVGPALTVSLSDEAQLDAGAYFSLGDGSTSTGLGSEFGSQPDFYYASVKIYF
jgi:hypothetical protein